MTCNKVLQGGDDAAIATPSPHMRHSRLAALSLFARLKTFFANTDGLFSFHIDPIGEMSVFRKKSIVFSNWTRVRTCTHCDNSTFPLTDFGGTGTTSQCSLILTHSPNLNLALAIVLTFLSNSCIPFFRKTLSTIVRRVTDCNTHCPFNCGYAD